MSPPQSLHARSFSTIHAASPAGESVSPDRRGLRLGALHRHVGALGRAPGRHVRHRGALLGRQVGGVPQVDRHPRVHAVDGRDPFGVVQREEVAHPAADVPAGGAEPLVAEAVQQSGPQASDGDRVERRAGRAVGVPVAGHVGHDHVERVGGIAAVRPWVGQQRNDLRVAPERVRPAVAEHQRQHRAGRVDGPGVHVVKAEPVEPGAEARELGQRLLLGCPVEAVGPVGDQVAEVAGVRAE